MHPDYLKRTIVKEELSSTHLGDNRTLHIYLPPGYDSGNPHPVLILQDGKDYLTMGRIATQTNRLTAEGKIHPPVIVMIPVEKERRTAEYAPVGIHFDAYRRFVVEEVLPAVENRFAVKRDPEERVIGGSSLGATVALHLALDFPGQFRRVMSQSGAFLESTLDRIHQSATLKGLQVYQSIGQAETAVPTHIGKLDLLARNREVFRVLQEKGATVRYVEKEGNHTWGLWQKDLPDALTYFFGK